MRRVFLLSSATGPNDTATILAGGLPTDRFQTAIGYVPQDRYLDPRGWTEFRRTLSDFSADVVHAFGHTAVRTAVVAAHHTLYRRPAVVASAVALPTNGTFRWLSKLAVRMADRVTDETEAGADRFRKLGVAAERLVVIPPGVHSPTTILDPVQFRREHDIPDDGRLIVAAGSYDSAEGMKSAVWAFDVAKYAHTDLYLILVGDGPERRRVERFARGIAPDDYRVRFVESPDNLPAVFGLADVAWVMYARGGAQTALAAMSAGVPVVASASPDLASVIDDGVTGRLAPLTDRVLFAKLTHELLGAPAEGKKRADAGRAAAAEFTPGRLIERFAALYDDLHRSGETG